MVISPDSIKTIKNPKNDIRSECHGRDEATGGWIGAVDRYDGGSRSVLISSLPTTFATARSAVAHMRGLVEKIRAGGNTV